MLLHEALEDLKTKLEGGDNSNPNASAVMACEDESWFWTDEPRVIMTAQRLEDRASKQYQAHCVGILNEIRRVYASDPSWKFSWVPGFPNGEVRIYVDAPFSLRIPNWVGFVKVYTMNVTDLNEYMKSYITAHNWVEQYYAATWYKGLGQDPHNNKVWLHVSDDFDLNKVDVPGSIRGCKIPVYSSSGVMLRA